MLSFHTLAPATKLTCSYDAKRTKDNVTFIWPETPINSNASFTCPNNPQYNVTRKCGAGGDWKDYDQQGCGVLLKELVEIMKMSERV